MAELTTDFNCPCGKGYHSYPALYTHIKRKHDGKAPGELSIPKRTVRRGRPAIEMHEVPRVEKTSEMDLLNMLEVAIIEVRDIDSGCILSRNEEPKMKYPEAHPYFNDSKPSNPMYQAMVEFTEEFCLHFKLYKVRRVLYMMSCLFWWLERIKKPFAVGLMEDFLKKGFEQQTKIRKVETFYDKQDIKLYKIVAVALSKWLFGKELTTEVLELNV